MNGHYHGQRSSLNSFQASLPGGDPDLRMEFSFDHILNASAYLGPDLSRPFGTERMRALGRYHSWFGEFIVPVPLPYLLPSDPKQPLTPVPWRVCIDKGLPRLLS